MRTAIEGWSRRSGIDLIFVEGHDDAIVGLTERFGFFSVLYSELKILETLASDMTLEDAREFFDFNILGAYVGENGPSFLLGMDWDA